MSIVCKCLGHRVDRRRVWNDGIDFRTSCVRCARPLLRDDPGWRAFDPDRDSHENRSPHPKHDKG